MNISDKYPTIPYGQFQGIITTLTAMEEKVTKPIKDVCHKARIFIDEELEYVDCYYRFVNECLPQSDVPERLLKIEVAEKEGVLVHLDDWQMQTACETILNQHAKTY